jgi:transcriptional regulator with XRE-family HTH domain
MSRSNSGGRKGGPNSIDVEVGKRIRTYRLAAGHSQTTLADALGLTFQQVQKYEKGINRVAPSRLEVIASQCKVPVTAFYPSMDDKNGSAPVLPFDSLGMHGAQDLLAAYSKIKRSKMRSALVALAEAMADSA